MTASLSTMTIDYYLKTAAADGAGQDMTSYYVSAKSPAGRWFGSGLAGLNVEAGTEVTREAALSLFRDHADPLTGEVLGRPVMRQRQAPEGATTPSGKPAKDSRSGVHGFDMTFSPPKSVSTLWALAEPQVQGEVYAAHQQAVEEALRWAEANVIQSRAGHAGTAQVEVEGVAASLFDHWDSRNGDPQLHTHAVIVNKVQRTSDGQWVTLDSHSLYRHMVAISEKYNSLLYDRLHQRVGALPETRGGSAVMTTEALLAAAESGEQAQTKTVDSAGSHRVELTGIPEGLIEEFSTRVRQIEERKDELIAFHLQRTGRQPSNATVLKYRQQATLESRQAKDTDSEETLPEKMAGWRRRAISAGFNPDQVIREAVGHPSSVITAQAITSRVTDSLGSWTLNDASMRRTTFTRANVMASAERVTRLVRCNSAAERDQIVSQVVEDALSKAMDLTPRRFPRFDAPEHTDPAALNRGESVFEHRGTSGVFTTRQIMDEEAYLIARTQVESAPAVADAKQVETSLVSWRSPEGHRLSEDQHRASSEVLSSHAGISAVIGPAGTGKTTTMSAITDAWQTAHGQGSVIGLAPSAVAAGVLGDEIGVATENTAKWLYESIGPGAARRAQWEARNRRQLADLLSQDRAAKFSAPWRSRKIDELRAKLAADHAAQAKYQLYRDQLLIIDEASMVATPQLAELASQAERAGAKVLLVGDPAQLEAVDAGGFLGHMERNMDVSQLDHVWRFANDWEKQASLALREGRESALEDYAAHQRVHGAVDRAALDQAYQRWKADHDAGKSSVLIASDNQTVDQLNQQAHADRVAAGEVDIEQSITVRGDLTAGVGETLLARKNDRTLRDSKDVFVANGTRLTVTGIRPDGSAEAAVEATGATLTLDKTYLAESVELGYAVTAHRAQGVTVATGHAVVAEGLSRELFYVAMTRGKESNDAYVELASSDESAVATWKGAGDGVVAMHEAVASDDPMDALKGVLARAQAEKSAHEIQAAEHGWAHDLGRMIHERSYLTWAARTSRTQHWIEEHYTPVDATQLFTDGDWQRLVSADPALNHTGEVATAESVATVLARCQRPAETTKGPEGMLAPVLPDNEVQAATLTALETQITDQVAIRAAQTRTEQPDWYQELAGDYPEGVVPQRDLDAVLMWRAASNQTDASSPFGKPPPAGDYLTPLWERMRERLNRERPTSQAAGAEESVPHLPPAREQPARDVDPVSWDAMAEAWEDMELFDVAEVEHDDASYWNYVNAARQPQATEPIVGPTT